MQHALHCGPLGRGFVVIRRERRTEEIIGFALSGGGARGASQAGALKAITEAGIWPQLVAGTSAGAVNAAWLALHPHRLDKLEAIWLALRTQDVFPGNRVRLLLNFTRRGYVHAADAWESFLVQHLGNARFEETELSCAVVAVRLSDGERVVFERGELVPAIMASTAIPGVFPPYCIGGELYVDGGVLEFLPVPTLIERGATVTYAMDSSWFGPMSSEIGAVVDRCSRISARASADMVTSLPSTRGTSVHLLRPELKEFADARDFRHSAELVRAGYDQASQYLREHGSISASS